MKRALKIVGIALLAIGAVLLVLRLFFYEVARLQGEDMMPSLGVGAIVVVRKGATPARGDLVLFEKLGGPRVRRVVAVPGDRITIDGLVPVVNGERPTYEELYDVTVAKRPMRVVRETAPSRAPGPTTGLVLDDQMRSLSALDAKVVEGGYFVMADHREHGVDSRNFGVVSADEIRGVIVWVVSEGEVPARSEVGSAPDGGQAVEGKEDG